MSDVFCMIVDGAIPSYVIHEDDLFLIILDRYPWTKGHSLIVLKRHAESIYDLTDVESRRLMELVMMMSRRLKRALNPDGLNVMQNNGAAAGQSVSHFHTHLIPRNIDDGVIINFPHNDPDENEFNELVTLLKGDI